MGLDKIAIYKKKLNLTTEELSKKSGVPIGTLNKILSGATKDPKLETLKAIARVLGLSLDDFDDDDQVKSSLSPEFKEVIELYSQLDSMDRVKIIERMHTLLEMDKYKKDASYEKKQIS